MGYLSTPPTTKPFNVNSYSVVAPASPPAVQAKETNPATAQVLSQTTDPASTFIYGVASENKLGNPTLLYLDEDETVDGATIESNSNVVTVIQSGNGNFANVETDQQNGDNLVIGGDAAGLTNPITSQNSLSRIAITGGIHYTLVNDEKRDVRADNLQAGVNLFLEDSAIRQLAVVNGQDLINNLSQHSDSFVIQAGASVNITNIQDLTEVDIEPVVSYPAAGMIAVPQNSGGTPSGGFEVSDEFMAAAQNAEQGTIQAIPMAANSNNVLFTILGNDGEFTHTDIGTKVL